MIQLGLCWGWHLTDRSFQRRHGYKNKIPSDHLETIFTDQTLLQFQSLLVCLRQNYAGESHSLTALDTVEISIFSLQKNGDMLQ